jgi:hypothetical protein
MATDRALEHLAKAPCARQRGRRRALRLCITIAVDAPLEGRPRNGAFRRSTEANPAVTIRAGIAFDTSPGQPIDSGARKSGHAPNSRPQDTSGMDWFRVFHHRCWAKVLILVRIGHHVNFLDLDSRSLRAVEHVSRIREALPVDIGPQVVFRKIAATEPLCI